MNLIFYDIDYYKKTKNELIKKWDNLIYKYYDLILKNNIGIFNYDKNKIRVVFYNVMEYKFKQNSRLDIDNLILKLNPSIVNLIEHNKNHKLNSLKDFKYQTKFTNYDDCCIKSFSKLKTHNCSSFYINTYSDENFGATHLPFGIFNIITIHLDVHDESGKIRLFQIKKIHKYILDKKLKNVIIGGDFNENNIPFLYNKFGPILVEILDKEFKYRTKNNYFMPYNVSKYLTDNNYSCLLKNKKLIFPFTCWSLKFVDYIYIYKPTWNNKLNIENINILYTNISDHFPIILDFKIS